MFCVLNLKNKMSFENQKNIIRNIKNKGRNIKLLIAPILPQQNNYEDIEIISQNIAIKERSVGDISAELLKEYNISYSIIGHLERRFHNIDSLESIKNRLENALENKITPILCIGIDNNIDNIRDELNFLFEGLNLNNQKIIIAYEDFQSTIQGKRVYTFEEIGELHKFINLYLEKIQVKNSNFKFKLLFGGAVTLDSIPKIKSMGYDGILLGDRFRTVEPIMEILDSLENA